MRTDVFEPVMDSIEKPEALFTTTDDEVSFKNYVSLIDCRQLYKRTKNISYIIYTYTQKLQC